MLTEPSAIHGISPEVYKQNLQIIENLGQVACGLTVEPIAIQVIGSRSNGSADTQSDVDWALLSFGDDSYPDVYDISLDLNKKTWVTHDPTMARVCVGITSRIPATFEELDYWAESSAPFCLFNSGVGDNHGRQAITLLKAATTALLMQKDRETRVNLWGQMRDEYNNAYLGDLSRIQRKLDERLDFSEMPISDIIDNKLMNVRRLKFGFPSSLRATHAALLRDVSQMKPTVESPTTERAWDLYSDVQRAIAA